MGVLALGSCEIRRVESHNTPEQVLLQVISDNGLGSIVSTPDGINCGSQCSATFDKDSTVQLTATPEPDTKATFLGWEGACTGTELTCLFTMDGSKEVTAKWKRPDSPDMAMPPDLAPNPAPTISAVAPPYAPNNTPTNITVTGTNFRAGATVTVGGQTCSNLSVVSASQITCTVPAKAATCGSQAVLVTNTDTSSATKSAFFYRAASVVFATPVALTGTLSGPHKMVTADFNGDGKLDLAHSNASANNVSVYLGDGTGGFGTATNFTVGTSPIGLAVGDLNMDNKLDLVVSNPGDNSISFLAGNGMGGFAAAVNTMGLSGPEGVAIGDIDNDTYPDVVVANPGANNVVILKGNGMGGLVMGTPVSVGASARYLALADVTKDQKLDLLVPNQAGNTISFRPGNGNGTFGAGMDIAVGIDPYEIIVGDVNGDQSPDFLFTSSNTGKVGVLLGNGQGTFTAAAGSPFTVGASPTFMSVADLNGDGRLDFATANQSSANLSILVGNGAGGFSAVPTSPIAGGNGPTGVATGDFNGDGLIDLANTNFFANSAVVRLAVCN